MGWCRTLAIRLVIDETRQDMRRRRREMVLEDLPAAADDDPQAAVLDQVMLDAILARLDWCAESRLKQLEQRAFLAPALR
ncbi:MAG: hypothetical protein R2873_21330 [Caldilineaceae bacterium]